MGISIWQLLIILAIVLVLFGAKRLRNVGSDLGSAVKGFRGAMQDTDDRDDDKHSVHHLENGDEDDHTFEGESRRRDTAGEDNARKKESEHH